MGDVTAELSRDEILETFEYLDVLRESGVTNMFGAGEYLRGAFGWDKGTSGKVLQLWMKTFDGDLPADERVTAAVGEEER